MSRNVARIPVFLPSGQIDLDVGFRAERGSYERRYSIYVRGAGPRESTYVGWVIGSSASTRCRDWSAWISGDVLDRDLGNPLRVCSGAPTRNEAVVELLREIAARRPYSGPLRSLIEGAAVEVSL